MAPALLTRWSWSHPYTTRLPTEKPEEPGHARKSEMVDCCRALHPRHCAPVLSRPGWGRLSDSCPLGENSVLLMWSTERMPTCGPPNVGPIPSFPENHRSGSRLVPKPLSSGLGWSELVRLR